jgi:hypothetical protein
MAKQQDKPKKQTLKSNMADSSKMGMANMPFKQATATPKKKAAVVVAAKAPVKKTVAKTPVAKKAPAKPIQLKEVVVSSARKQTASRSDSTSVGSFGGKEGKMFANKDLKEMVKKKQLSSLDTTSKSTLARTAYGKGDLVGMMDYHIAKNKKSK